MKTEELKWEHYGTANGWMGAPERVKEAWGDLEADLTYTEIGNCLTEVRCEKYRFTYRVDSSD